MAKESEPSVFDGDPRPKANLVSRRTFIDRTLRVMGAWMAAGAVPSTGCSPGSESPPKSPLVPAPSPTPQAPPEFANRVVHVRNPKATLWDFANGYYYDHACQTPINNMMDSGIVALTGVSSPEAAWQRILAQYQVGDVVAVKINTNDINWGDNLINSVPELINSVIRGIKSAGVPENLIHVFDATRPANGPMPARYLDKTHALYPGVVFQGPDRRSFNGGYPNQQISMATWSGRICDYLCAAQHLIVMPILKAIRVDWGNSGALKLHHGTIDDPLSTHSFLANTDPTWNPVTAINSNPHIRDKLRLVVGDGLFGMWSGRHFFGAGETTDIPSPWRTFNQEAANSLLLAVDPVAADSVQCDIINRERQTRGLTLMNHPIIDACAAVGLGRQEHSLDLTYSRIDYRTIALS